MAEIRYYIVPLILTGGGIQPKYLAEIDSKDTTAIRGVFGRELAPDAEGNKRFLQNYYILRIEKPDGADWAALDSKPDVIHLTRQKLINNRTKLDALGIDTTGLTLTTSRKSIERRLVQWLTAEDKDLSQVFGGAGEIG